MTTGTCLFRAGMARDEALQAFSAHVNRPGTIFSTSRWLDEKLALLACELGETITEDQAQALDDVLHERAWMRELVSWLQGPPMRWTFRHEFRQWLSEMEFQHRVHRA